MIKMKECKVCGKKFKMKSSWHKYCSVKCRNIFNKKFSMDYRLQVLKKIANGELLKCAVCGCPHVEALTIGHFNNDGKRHRERLSDKGISINTWILKTPLELVRKKVQLECVYCQYYFKWTGKYPSKNKRPKWK